MTNKKQPAYKRGNKQGANQMTYTTITINDIDAQLKDVTLSLKAAIASNNTSIITSLNGQFLELLQERSLLGKPLSNDELQVLIGD